MKGLRLYKKEKLCSATAIGELFTRRDCVSSALAFPLRAMWRVNPRRHSDAPVAFLISVPKKRLRHAVDRVTMRRRIREAYRLCRPSFPLPEGIRVDLAFIYVTDTLRDYTAVDRAVRRIMSRVQTSLAAAPATSHDTPSADESSGHI